MVLAIASHAAASSAQQTSAPGVVGAPAAAEQTVSAAPADAAATTSYRVGKGDVLEIGVVGRDDYRARIQVQDDGTILLPLVNSLRVEQLTLLEIRDAVASALKAGGYYVNPAVSVIVVNYASRYITVLGQVRTPGVVPIDRDYRLSEIIARAGGVNDPNIDDVTVTPKGGEPTEYSLRAIATGGASVDPLVGEGAKVFIAPPKSYYVYGQVGTPGSFPMEPNITIRMALAKAGGLTAMGSAKRVTITRGEREFKKVDLNEKLAPGDIVVVGERFF
jgi:polysaccharide export outer membrane protein